MTTKIAPTLTILVDGHKFAYPDAHRELRALLAVARAARDHSHAEVEPTRDGSPETCPICRALSGLTRVKR